MNENIKNQITDILQACQLPALEQNLDNVPLNQSTFKECHNVLLLNLPLLYDAVQQIWNMSSSLKDPECEKIFVNLVLVLCEVSAPDTVFRLPDYHLVKTAENLLKTIKLNDEIVKQIFTNYQSKLQKETWKRQLGAIHGFLQFLKKRYSSGQQHMSLQEMNFCLSVALNVRECYDVIYKQMGIQIFSIILDNTHADDIKNVNIHEVIYESVFKDVHYMDSVDGTHAIWDCLMKCLKFCNVDSTNWSYADDMVENLMRDIPIAPNADISLCMLKFITKLGYHFSSNHEDILQRSSTILNKPENVNAMKGACDQNNSYLIYRWAKNLLQMLVIEAYKLKQSQEICCQMLQEIHSCFLVYIWPLPLPVIAFELKKFYEKYILLLREVILFFKSEPAIVQLIMNFLQTCQHKFNSNSAEGTLKKDYADINMAFETLFQADLFL